MDSDVKLLGCPFCGVQLEKGLSHLFGHPNYPTDCPAARLSVHPDKPEEVRLWNTRHSTPPGDDEVERAARAMCDRINFSFDGFDSATQRGYLRLARAALTSIRDSRNG